MLSHRSVPPLLDTLLNPECLPLLMPHPYMEPRPYSILSSGEPSGWRPRRGIPLRRRTGRSAHAGGRVQSLWCEAPGRAGAARVSDAWVARGLGSRTARTLASRAQPRPCRPQFLLHGLHFWPDWFWEDIHSDWTSTTGGQPGEAGLWVGLRAGRGWILLSHPHCFTELVSEELEVWSVCVPIWAASLICLFN